LPDWNLYRKRKSRKIHDTLSRISKSKLRSHQSKHLQSNQSNEKRLELRLDKLSRHLAVNTPCTEQDCCTRTSYDIRRCTLFFKKGEGRGGKRGRGGGGGEGRVGKERGRNERGSEGREGKGWKG